MKYEALASSDPPASAASGVEYLVPSGSSFVFTPPSSKCEHAPFLASFEYLYSPRFPLFDVGVPPNSPHDQRLLLVTSLPRLCSPLCQNFVVCHGNGSVFRSKSAIDGSSPETGDVMLPRLWSSPLFDLLAFKYGLNFLLTSSDLPLAMAGSNHNPTTLILPFCLLISLPSARWSSEVPVTFQCRMLR